MRYGATFNRCFIEDSFAPKLGEISKQIPEHSNSLYSGPRSSETKKINNPCFVSLHPCESTRQKLKFHTSEASIMAAFILKMLTAGQQESREPDP